MPTKNKINLLIFILIIFSYNICNSQTPIYIIKKDYKLINYKCDTLVSKIQLNNENIINIFTSNEELYECLKEEKKKNIILISSLIYFEIKEGNILFKKNVSNIKIEPLDLKIINIIKDKIRSSDFKNLSKKNCLAIFIYMDYNKSEFGLEVIEVIKEKYLLIHKEIHTIDISDNGID